MSRWVEMQTKRYFIKGGMYIKYIASCSFGKDSIAAIIVWNEGRRRIEEAVYCKIMFDDETKWRNYQNTKNGYIM